MLINLLNIKQTQRFLFIACLLCFLSSVTAEIILSKKPCDLCLVTRYFYLLIAATSFFSTRVSTTFPKKILLATLFTAFCFSFYHLGVENHWWPGPATCTTKLLTNMESIMNNKAVRCDVVNWKIFGISSTLYSLCITTSLFWIYSLSFIMDCVNRRNDY